MGFTARRAAIQFPRPRSRDEPQFPRITPQGYPPFVRLPTKEKKKKNLDTDENTSIEHRTAVRSSVLDSLDTRTRRFG